MYQKFLQALSMLSIRYKNIKQPKLKGNYTIDLLCPASMITRGQGGRDQEGHGNHPKIG